jgi:hypothetical protein
MKTEIKFGMTIIHTQEDHIGVRNKLGCPGISRYNNTDKWRTDISIRQKKYLVGIFDNLQDAIKARKIAEQKKQSGTLVQWLDSRPHGNHLYCKEFWENEFKRMDENENC